jgi:DNA sulfur modification protein DndD
LQLVHLKAKNWGVYYPSIEISFGEKKGKPLWIFEGLTGFGKTTLFLAFVWALYGERGLNFHTKQRPGGIKRTIDMISRQAIASGDYNMNVELHFVEGERRYIIKRYVPPLARRPATNAEVKTIVKLIDDKGDADTFPDERISEMLPLEASQFFFFAGEMLSKYTEPSSRETKDAIERVLGFPEIRAASEDVASYIRKLGKILQGMEEVGETFKHLLKEREELEAQIQDTRGALGDAKVKYREVDAKIPDLQAKFEQYESIQEEIRKLKELEKENQFLEEELNRLGEARYEKVRRLPFLLAYRELEKRYDRFKQRTEIESAEAGINRVSIIISKLDELVKSDRCWCGNPIEDFERRSLRQALASYTRDRSRYESLAKDQTIPSMLELSTAIGFLRGLDADFSNVDAEMKRTRIRIDDNAATIVKIQDRIGNAPVQQIRLTKKLLDEYLEERGRLSEEVRQTQARLEKLEGERDDTTRTLSRMKTESSAIEALSRRYDLAEKTYRALEYALKELANVKRRVIEENATELMLSVVRKPDWGKLTIEDDYSIQLYDKSGVVIPRKDISDGEKEILALSFIYGLKEATERAAPVVIDFLLGRLDLEYQDSVAENLHRFGDQVLYFVLDSELTEDRKRLMASHCNAWHLIEFNETTLCSQLGMRREG